MHHLNEQDLFKTFSVFRYHLCAVFFRYQANLDSIQFCSALVQLSVLLTYLTYFFSFVLSLSHFLTQYTIRLCTSKLLYGVRLCINFVCVPLIDWNIMECVLHAAAVAAAATVNVDRKIGAND